MPESLNFVHNARPWLKAAYICDKISIVWRMLIIKKLSETKRECAEGCENEYLTVKQTALSNSGVRRNWQRNWA